MARTKHIKPREYRQFCINVSPKWIRFIRCMVELNSFESVSAGFREMMECWFVDNFGHDFETYLTNMYKEIDATPKARKYGKRPKPVTKKYMN